MPSRSSERPTGAQSGEASNAVTALLASWRRGDSDAANQLFPVVYRELQRLARLTRRSLPRSETLRTTAIVHEAYLKLVDQTAATINDRHHFFALASRVMRQVLVDGSRRRAAAKRGGDVPHISIDDVAQPDAADRAINILALDAALDRLEAIDDRLRQIVELRVFSGLTVEQTAEVIGASPRTVKRDWRKARAFLLVEMGG